MMKNSHDDKGEGREPGRKARTQAQGARAFLTEFWQSKKARAHPSRRERHDLQPRAALVQERHAGANENDDSANRQGGCSLGAASFDDTEKVTSHTHHYLTSPLSTHPPSHTRLLANLVHKPPIC
jgi:hypothetical protein